MADVIIDSGISTSTARVTRAVVWHPTDASIGYVFYIDSDGHFGYSKTTDGGASWGGQVDIASPTTHLAAGIWPDWWTPGDSGTKIHTVYFDTTGDDVTYRSLDISSDTLGTPVIVEAESSAVANAANHCPVAKAIGGNLYVQWSLDAAAEFGFERSTDGGVNWTARTNGIESASLDWLFMLPAANTGDTNDMLAVYLDASTDELTVKWYDDSANTWTESSVLATVVDNTGSETGQLPFAASIRHSDGHIIIAVVTQRDLSTADHRVFDVDRTSGAFSITELTAITTDIDDHYYPSVFIDQTTDDIYVAYNGKRDGLETLGTTTKVYYTKSTDDGTSWSSGDTAYMEGAAAAILQTWAPLMGTRFYVAWRRDSTVLEGNAVNSLTFGGAPPAGGGSIIPWIAAGRNSIIGAGALVDS